MPSYLCQLPQAFPPFFPQPFLEELCQRYSCANEALPCYLCVHLSVEKTPWKEITCFISKHRLFILPSTSPVVFRINMNNKSPAELEAQVHSWCPADGIMMVMRVVNVNMCYSA